MKVQFEVFVEIGDEWTQSMSVNVFYFRLDDNNLLCVQTRPARRCYRQESLSFAKSLQVDKLITNQ
jgi:hypothetical protein